MPSLPPQDISFSLYCVPHYMDTLFLNRASHLQTVLLDTAYINDIMHLREEVFFSLEHADYYVREQNEYEFIAQHCGLIGDTFGIFLKKRLVAYASLSYHNFFEGENLGTLIGLPLEQHKQISQLASCMVAPTFQGLGLHKILIEERMQTAYEKGYPHCLALVSPQNIPSRRNLFKRGFQIHWVGTLPGLSIQHILYRNALQPTPKLAIHQAQKVAINDINLQKQLLAQGYYGYTDLAENVYTLLFAPPLIV